MKKLIFLMKSLNQIRLLHGWALAILFTLVFSVCQEELDDQPFQQDEISNSLIYKNDGRVYNGSTHMSFNPGMI